MKRVLSILSLTLVLVMCLFMFASCGINKYEKNLEKAGYEVEEWDDEDIEEGLDMFGVDYKVKKAFEAEDSKGNYVVVIKFGSKKDAKEFANDTNVKMGASFLGGKIQYKGSVVMIGNQKALDDAVGK